MPPLGKAASLAANEHVPFSAKLRALAPAPKVAEPASLAGKSPITPQTVAAAPKQSFSEHLKTIAAPKPFDPFHAGRTVSPPIHGTASRNVIDIKTPHAVSAAGDRVKEGFLKTQALTNSLIAHPLRNSGIPALGGKPMDAQAAIDTIHVKNGKVVFTGTDAQRVEAMGYLIPKGGLLGSAQEVMGIGPGIGLLGVQAAHDPLRTAGSVAKGIGSSMAGTFTNGHAGSKTNTPLDDVMNLWTAATLGAGAAGRVGAMGAADGIGATAKAATFRPKQAPRGIHVGDGDLAKTITAAASRNPAAALLQRRAFDRLLQHSLNTGHLDLGGVLLRRFGSPEARVARLGRNDLRVQNELGAAPAAELAKYGAGVTKRAAKGKLGGLTMAQQHAAFISSLGHTPATFAKASENAIEHADHLSQLEGVPAATIRQNHHDLLAKTKLSAQYFDEHGHLSHPLVKQAAAAMHRAISAREETKGMTAEEIQHALGSRWYAVHHLASDPTKPSLHSEIGNIGSSPQAVEKALTEAKGQLATAEAKFAKDAESMPTDSTFLSKELLGQYHADATRELRAHIHDLTAQQAAWARHDKVHSMFRKKGAQLQKDGAFYLPQSSETKALAKVVQGVTRRTGPYGYAPPRVEKTYAQMGHLFNTGDYRTQAVPLAQHAFGRAHLLQSQQRLHEMLLALSKKTPEEVGHPHPVPIRVAGAPTPELKRFINELYQGDHATAEGAGAEALWKHLLPGHVPEGAKVRYLHPDVAAIFKPHHASELARNVGRFNQIVRAQRFLNPKYGIWNVQNAVLGVPQQGALMPANALRYLRVVRHLDPETYSKIESTVGAGMSKSLTAPGDTKLVQHLAGFWHHVNDHAYRMMSFVHEARAEGIHTAAQFKELMGSTDPGMVAKRTQIVQRANREAIDYGAMTSLERESVRRYAAYWPWTRGASAWTLRMAREHPLWAQLNLEAGRRGKKYIDDFYGKHGGMAPPSLEGSYPAKSGPIDMEAFNTPSTLAQDVEALSGIFDPSATKYLTGTALGQAAPAVKSIQELATGLSKYGSSPRHGSVLGQTLHDLVSSVEPLQLAKAAVGRGRPASATSPGGFVHELERWAGDPQQTGVSYDNLAAYGASINRGSLRGTAQAAATTKDKMLQVAQLATKVKLDAGERQAYVTYWKNQGVLMQNVAVAAQKSGALSDKTKSTDQSLSFKDPVAYVTAYATAAAQATGDKNVVGEVKVIVAQVNADKTLNAQQKGNLLYKVAQKIWTKVNPPHVASVYYQRLAQAGIGG